MYFLNDLYKAKWVCSENGESHALVQKEEPCYLFNVFGYEWPNICHITSTNKEKKEKEEINYDFQSNLNSFLPGIVCRNISIYRTISLSCLEACWKQKHKDFSQTMDTPLTPRLMPLLILD